MSRKTLASRRWTVVTLMSCSLGLGLGDGADAAITPVSYARQVSTFAFLDTNIGSDALRTDETITSEEGGGFSQQAVCHLKQLGSQVTATADQISEISADEITATFAGSAGATVINPSHSALAIMSTGIVYVFSVDVTTGCQLTLDVEAMGLATFDLSIRLSNGGSLLNRQFFSTNERYEETIQLPPGTYELAAGGGGDGGAGPNGTGFSNLSATFAATFPVAADVSAWNVGVPSLTLSPNPMHEVATLTLAGPGPSSGKIAILDASGRRVRALELPATRGGGEARITWDALDERGAPVAPGVYWLSAGNGVVTRAVVVH